MHRLTHRWEGGEWGEWVVVRGGGLRRLRALRCFTLARPLGVELIARQGKKKKKGNMQGYV